MKLDNNLKIRNNAIIYENIFLNLNNNLTSNNDLASERCSVSNLNIAATSQNLGSCFSRLRSAISTIFSFKSTINRTRA